MASHVPLTAEAKALVRQLRAAIERSGWTETARRTGLERSALYRSFPAKRGNSGISLRSVAAVAQAHGYRLTLTPIEAAPARDLNLCPDGDGGYG